MDGSKLFKNFAAGGWRGGAALYMSAVWVPRALCGMEEEPAEGLWVRISRQAKGWHCCECLIQTSFSRSGQLQTTEAWSLGVLKPSEGPCCLQLWVCITLCLLGNCNENTRHGSKTLNNYIRSWVLLLQLKEDTLDDLSHCTRTKDYGYL